MPEHSEIELPDDDVIIWHLPDRDGLDVYRVTKGSMVLGEFTGRSIGTTVFQTAAKIWRARCTHSLYAPALPSGPGRPSAAAHQSQCHRTALREAHESAHWLEALLEARKGDPSEARWLLAEVREFAAMLRVSVRNLSYPPRTD